MKRTLTWIVAVMMFTTWVPATHAVLTNLLVNGDFESPAVFSPGVNDGQFFTDAQFDTSGQWFSSTGNNYELWQQGFLGSPTLGSDGLATGQHLEVRGQDGGGAWVAFQVTIPGDLLTNVANLNFDSWFRTTGNSGTVFLFVNGSNVGSAIFAGSTAAWNANSFNITNISQGQNIALLFRNNPTAGPADEGLHLDDIEFLVDIAAVAAIPEPAQVGVLLLAAVMGASLLRRRSRASCNRVVA